MKELNHLSIVSAVIFYFDFWFLNFWIYNFEIKLKNKCPLGYMDSLLCSAWLGNIWLNIQELSKTELGPAKTSKR